MDVGDDRDDGAPTPYYFYFSAARDESGLSDPPLKGFDLLRMPEDVCFYLSGGNSLGFGYRSNKVRIPKEAIAAALQNLPPYFRDAGAE